jgi:DNA-binding NarL/FixJ family response regulator
MECNVACKVDLRFLAARGGGDDHTERSREGEHSGRGQRSVLIVEDDYFVGVGVEQALKAAGYGVVGIAARTSEAVAMAVTHRPDVILMDITLAEGSDGIAAAIEILAVTGIRCIFASAYSDDGTRGRAAAARPLGWIAKPYSPDAVIRMVRTVLADDD